MIKISNNVKLRTNFDKNKVLNVKANTNLKVLQLISGNDNGGGGNHVLNLCIYSKDKFKCVLGCVGKGPLYEKAIASGVEVVLFNPASAVNDEIIKYIDENSIDLINIHGAKQFFMNCFMKKKLKVPAVASVHSDYRYDFDNNKIKKIIFTPLSKKGLKSFKYYIGISQNIKELLENQGFKGEKFNVNNGIDLSKVTIKISREELRKTYNISENDFVYVCIARMHPIKNHDSLIDAFNKLSKEFKDVKLLLLGDGEIEETLKEKTKSLGLSNKIIFVGYKTNTIDFINASDVGILCSYSEGGAPPLAILESAAGRKTVLCTEVGDMEKIVEDNQNGFLINTNSVDNIYIKMKDAYINKENLSIMGEKLFSLVCEKYTMDNFVGGYYNIYEEILGR